MSAWPAHLAPLGREPKLKAVPRPAVEWQRILDRQQNYIRRLEAVTRYGIGPVWIRECFVCGCLSACQHREPELVERYKQ